MILLYQIKRDKRDKFQPGAKNPEKIIKNFEKPLDNCTDSVYNILVR